MHLACWHTATGRDGLTNEKKKKSPFESRGLLNVIVGRSRQRHRWPSSITYAPLPTCCCCFSILCLFMQTVLWNFAIFVFLHSFTADYAIQVFFLHPILNEVCSERKQDFTLTVSLSLYWSHRIYIFNYFYVFFYHTSFCCADIDDNTMCLFISLSRAWKTLLNQEEKSCPVKGQLRKQCKQLRDWKY